MFNKFIMLLMLLIFSITIVASQAFAAFPSGPIGTCNAEALMAFTDQGIEIPYDMKTHTILNGINLNETFNFITESRMAESLGCEYIGVKGISVLKYPSNNKGNTI